MAFSKSKLYDKEEQRTGFMAFAIRQPARQAILKTLSAQGPCSVQVLAKHHPIGKSSFSEHLRILREAGLVSCVEVFPYTVYKVEEKMVEEAWECVKKFFKTVINANKKRLKSKQISTKSD